MLCLQYECKLQGIELPWDDIVHRLNPGSSGPSAIQHLTKLRGYLAVEGHFVPPPLNSTCEPSIRGFVRDMDVPVEDAIAVTKVVTWDEDHEHLLTSLETPGVTIGSGNYQRKLSHGMTPASKHVHERPKIAYDPKYVKWLNQVRPKNRLSKTQAITKTLLAQKTLLQNSMQKPARKPLQKQKRARVMSEEPEDADESEMDPADLESDEDYSPESAKVSASKAVRKMPRKSAKKAARVPSSPSTASELSSDEDEDEDEAPQSLLVKLPVQPNKLRLLVGGKRIMPRTADSDVEIQDAGSESSSSSSSDEYEDEGYAKPAARAGSTGSKVQVSSAEYNKAHAAERAPGIKGIDEDELDISPQAIDNIVSTVFEGKSELRDALQASSG